MEREKKYYYYPNTGLQKKLKFSNNKEKTPLCLHTFTEDVNCVTFTEFQILWALCNVVI